VGLRGLLVAPLVVADDRTGVAYLRAAPPPAEHRRAPLVQRPAHLLRRHPRVFPPAAAPCASPRTPAPPGPGPAAASAPWSPAPRGAPPPPPPGPPPAARSPPPQGGEGARHPPPPGPRGRFAQKVFPPPRRLVDGDAQRVPPPRAPPPPRGRPPHRVARRPA